MLTMIDLCNYYFLDFALMNDLVIILTYSQVEGMIDLGWKKSPKIYNITVFTKDLIFFKSDYLILCKQNVM